MEQIPAGFEVDDSASATIPDGFSVEGAQAMPAGFEVETDPEASADEDAGRLWQRIASDRAAQAVRQEDLRRFTARTGEATGPVAPSPLDADLGVPSSIEQVRHLVRTARGLPSNLPVEGVASAAARGFTGGAKRLAAAIMAAPGLTDSANAADREAAETTQPRNVVAGVSGALPLVGALALTRGRALPAVGGAAVNNPATAQAIARLAPASAVAAEIGAASIAQNVQDRTQTPEEAMVNAAIEGLTTRLGGAAEPFIGLLRARPGLAPKMLDLLKEGGEESLAGGLQSISSQFLGNQRGPFDLGQVVEEAGTGGAAGLILAGASGGASTVAQSVAERQAQRRAIALDALRNLGGEVDAPATADPVQVDPRTAELGKALAPVLGPDDVAREEAGRAIEASAANDTAIRRQRLVRALADEAADISADRRAGMESLAKSESEAARRRELSAIADDAAASMNPEDQELPPEAGASERIVAEGRAPDARPVDDERKRFDTLARIRTETDQRHQLRVNATNARRQAGQIGKAQAAQEKAASDRQRLAEYGEAAQAVADGRPLPSWSALSTQEATDAQEDPRPRTGMDAGPVPVPGSTRAPAAPAPQAAPAAEAATPPSDDAGKVTRRARVVPVPNGQGFRVAITDGIRPVRFLRPGSQPVAAQEAQAFATAAEAEQAARSSLGDRWDVAMSDQARRQSEQAQRDAEMERAQQEAGDQAVADIEKRAREILGRSPNVTHYDLMRELSDYGFRVDKAQKLPPGADDRGLRLRQALAQRGEDLRGMFDRIKGEAQRVPPAPTVPSPAPRPVAPVEAGNPAPVPENKAPATEGGTTQAGKAAAPVPAPAAPPVSDRPGNNVTAEVTPANGGTGMTESQAAAPMDDDVPFRLAPDTAPAEFTGTTAGDIAQAFGPDAKVTARGPGSITVRLPNGATVEVMATGAISTSTAGAVAKGGAIVFRKNGAVVGRIMLVKGQTTAGTLPHEQYHIARGMGIITNAEHSELARAAAALFNRNPSLDGTPLQETLKLYQQNAKDSGRGPASVQEEMVAVAREYWAANPSEAPGANRSVWQKVTDFFRDLVAGLGLRAADARKILADLDSGRTWRRSPTSGEGGGMSVRPRWTPSAEKGGGFPLPKESSDSAEPATNKAGLRVREYVIAPHGGVDWGRLPAAKARELGIPVMPIRVQNGWNSRFNNGFGLEHVSERHGKEIARETGKPVEQFLQDAIDDMGSADIRPDGKEFVAVVPTQGARMVLTLINKDGALVVHSARPLYPHDMKKTAAGRPSQPRGNQPSAPPASSTPAVADGEGSRPVRTPSDGMIPEDGAGGNKMPQGDDAGGDTGSVRYSLAPSGVSLQAATPLGAPVTVGQNLPMLAPEKPRLRGFFRGFMRKYLTVASNLPKDAAARAFSMNHRITAMVDQLSYVERDYQKALKKAYAGKPSAADIEKINEVLRGNAPLSSVPVEMEPVLIQMRGLVDGLSREGIRSGLFQGDLAAKVAGNLGTYLHRSYAVHDDPAWAKKVPPQVLNRARSFIQAQNPNMTPEEVNGVIEEILHPDAAGGMHAGSMLGSKKLGFTKERKQIPEEIRDLMGEYKNPFVNFAKSFANMAAAVEQHKFLTDIRDNGMGVYFHQQPTKRDGVSFSAKIAGDTSKALDPLNGLYTTPEIAEAFREYRSSGWGRDGAHGAIWRTLATLNGITKQAKTVGNFPGGHIRNFLGNVLIAVGNGHLNMLHGLETRRYFSAETGMFGDNEKSREFVRRLTELGVVGAGFSGGEFRQLVRDAVGKSAEDFAAGTAKRMAMKPVNFLQGSYDLMDAFWRINGFLNERRALEKARPGMSDQALDEEAAKRVNDMYPTYERIAKVVQDLRKLPMIGTFTGFITEMARVSKNLIKYAAQDLQTPGMRSIGARRLVGTITAMSVPLAIAAISRSLANVDDDDEEALRRLAMPEWSRNSTIVWLPKDENGNQRYIDLSWTDPYSFMRDPLRALMSGRPKDAAVEALEPYLGWSLLAKAGIEAYMGNTASGRPIRRQGNTDAENAAATIGHIWKAFEPGTVGMLRRQYKAATGTTEDSGRNYQLDDEILAPLTGMRVGSADPWQALRFRGFDIARRWSDGRAQLRKAQQRSGATREDMNDAAERWDTVRGEIADDAAAIYTDAMRLGVTPKSAGAILSKAGVTGDAALAISIAVAKKARGDE